MKKILLGLIMVALSGWTWTAAHAQQTPQRILFVGNSYFYYNNSLHNHVKGLVDAAQPELGKKLDYKSATIGGAELQHHPIEWLIESQNIGVAQPFEWVILAGNSADALDVQSAQRFKQTVKRFDAIIRAHGARTALYMVHAYVAPNAKAHPNNIRQIAQMYGSVAREIGATVLPVGLAFEESYKRRPDLRLHSLQDGSHPSVYGTYLAACVVYAQIYQTSPIGNPYNMHGQVPSDIQSFLQQVAWDTVRQYHLE